MKNNVLAMVGGKEITQENIDFIIRSLDPQRAMQFQSEEGQKKLLEELVNQELFYLEAVNNKEGEEEAFQKQLAEVQSNLLKQYSINKLLSTVTVDLEEIQNYYNENKEQFKSPESIQASHILVDEEEKAQNIIQELKDGLSFEESAQKYSKCPSKAHGGNLGFFTKGKMVPEFETAAFSLEKGALSEPVKTQFGYHIIKVTAQQEETLKSFEEVKSQLAQKHLSIKQHEVYHAKINELKDKYQVRHLQKNN